MRINLHTIFSSHDDNVCTLECNKNELLKQCRLTGAVGAGARRVMLVYLLDMHRIESEPN